jgi:hypothetical protein
MPAQRRDAPALFIFCEGKGLPVIEKQPMFCNEREAVVDVLVEKAKPRRGSTQSAACTPIHCNAVAECPRTTFCRFVNPLTTRNPLVPVPETADAS